MTRFKGSRILNIIETVKDNPGIKVSGILKETGCEYTDVREVQNAKFIKPDDKPAPGFTITEKGQRELND